MSVYTRVYTGRECRELDRIAIEEFSISGLSLMRRAAEWAFAVLQRRWPNARSLSIVTGSGNNAGDGFIMAGLAQQRGWKVQLIPFRDLLSLKGTALEAWNWMREQGVEPDSTCSIASDVVVDALLGTGAVGEVRSPYLDAISLINSSGRPVLALDVPSGINADTGAKMTDAPVKAEATCTFGALKLGLVTGAGVNYVGSVEVDHLDIPEEVFAKVGGIETLGSETDKFLLPRRAPGSYKNRSGHVLVIGGDKGTGGAAILTAEAALRTGAGLVSVITRTDHVAAFLSRCPEVMVVAADERSRVEFLLTKADSIAIGPGLGHDAWGKKLLQDALDIEGFSRFVLDADALRIVGDQERDLPLQTIITPHPGEAAHLLKNSPQDVEQDRPESIGSLTSKYRCTAVLKGAGSLIGAMGELLYVACVSNPGMATGGSGDVLTGIIATARAQLDDPIMAAATGVWLHAEAGRRAVAKAEGRSIIASDLVDNIYPWGES